MSLGDGVFERLRNIDVMKYIWDFKKTGTVYFDIQSLCGNIAEGLLRYSMKKLSTDNVSTILIAFKNFESDMKNSNFTSNISDRCLIIPESYDLSEITSI